MAAVERRAALGEGEYTYSKETGTIVIEQACMFEALARDEGRRRAGGRG